MSEDMMKALAELGRRCREARAARADLDERQDALRRQWMGDREDYLNEFDDESYDDVRTSLDEYFDTGTADLPRSQLARLKGTREPFLAQLQEPTEALAVLEGAVVPPHESFVQCLRRWFVHARTDPEALKTWQDILKTWRRAVGRTTRDAANLLDVSSSAIVRYEQGNRTPSAPQVAAMIDCIAAGPVLPEQTELRIAAGRIARVFEGGDEEAVDMIENVERSTAEQCRAIEDALPILTSPQRGVVARLVHSPKSLDALDAWATQNQLAPVAVALHPDALEVNR